MVSRLPKIKNPSGLFGFAGVLRIFWVSVSLNLYRQRDACVLLQEELRLPV